MPYYVDPQYIYNSIPRPFRDVQQLYSDMPRLAWEKRMKEQALEQAEEQRKIENAQRERELTLREETAMSERMGHFATVSANIARIAGPRAAQAFWNKVMPEVPIDDLRENPDGTLIAQVGRRGKGGSSGENPYIGLDPTGKPIGVLERMGKTPLYKFTSPDGKFSLIGNPQDPGFYDQVSGAGYNPIWSRPEKQTRAVQLPDGRLVLVDPTSPTTPAVEAVPPTPRPMVMGDQMYGVNATAGTAQPIVSAPPSKPKVTVTTDDLGDQKVTAIFEGVPTQAEMDAFKALQPPPPQNTGSVLTNEGPARWGFGGQEQPTVRKKGGPLTPEQLERARKSLGGK